MPQGCCQCHRTKLFEKLFNQSGEKFEQRISWPSLQFVACGAEIGQPRLRQPPGWSDSGVVIHFSFQQLFIILISILPSTTPHTVWSEAHSHFLEASLPQNAAHSSQTVWTLNGSQDSYSNLEPTHENKRGKVYTTVQVTKQNMGDQLCYLWKGFHSTMMGKIKESSLISLIL